MIIIPFDLIEEIEATSEDPEFLAVNMIDSHCRKTWSPASGTSGTVNVKVIGSTSNALCLYYLLGSTVTVTIYNSTNLGGSVIYGPTAHSLLVSDSYYTNAVQIPGVFIEYTSPGVPHSAKLEITRSGDRPEIGRVFAGRKWALSRNPDWGLGRSPEDHSIIYDLDNGFEYLFQRNIRRVYDGTLQLVGVPSTEYFTFLHLTEQLGPQPVPVLMAQKVTPAYRYLCYGRFENVKGTEGMYNISTINFTLKEFL